MCVCVRELCIGCNKTDLETYIYSHKKTNLAKQAQTMIVSIYHPDGPRACHHDARGTVELPQLNAYAAPRTSLR